MQKQPSQLKSDLKVGLDSLGRRFTLDAAVAESVVAGEHQRCELIVSVTAAAPARERWARGGPQTSSNFQKLK